MNTNEFKSWLEGFLETKESICKKDVELIQQKMAETFPVMQGYLQTAPNQPYRIAPYQPSPWEPNIYCYNTCPTISPN